MRYDFFLSFQLNFNGREWFVHLFELITFFVQSLSPSTFSSNRFNELREMLLPTVNRI